MDVSAIAWRRENIFSVKDEFELLLIVRFLQHSFNNQITKFNVKYTFPDYTDQYDMMS